MQNYSQQPGYQSQSQWASPVQQQAPNQWAQPQQQTAGGYNPSIYGAMSGGQQAYAPLQQDQPPPPPPKPYGFAAAVQQQQQQQQNQGWSQQSQQITSNIPQQQGGYPVQGGFQTQQPYNQAAPPPPSATPGGSYFPPAQGGRPGSIYGANQAGSFSNSPHHAPPLPSTVLSPNEQQATYMPPSLTGQGVQAYTPSNTNPLPGVYVPPPPDVPAWQQAQHAPLQGEEKKFRYTKPTVDPSFYAQGYQGVQNQQPQFPPISYEQSPMGAPHPQQPPGPPPPSNNYAPPGQMPRQDIAQYQIQQQSQAPYGQQPPYVQNVPQGGQVPHQPAPYGIHRQDQPTQPPPVQMASYISKPHNEWEVRPPRPDTQESIHFGASNISKPSAQWEIPAPALAGQSLDQYQKSLQEQNVYVQPEVSQAQGQSSQHQSQDSQSFVMSQQHMSTLGQNVEAPKPLTRTDTTSSNFFSQLSPPSQPVSPVTKRYSVSFGHQHAPGRTDSVSSIALANLHAQRDGDRTSSPSPLPPKPPTPPPPRDDKSKFSALGTGGPSDWEHFGADAEIDDEESFAKKPGPAELDSSEIHSNELEPPSGPSPPSTHGWPSPAAQPTAGDAGASRDTYQPTPPPVVASLADRTAPQLPQQSFIVENAAPAPLSISPKPDNSARPPSAQHVLHVNGGGWAAPSSATQSRQQTPIQQPQQPPPITTSFVGENDGRGDFQQTPTQRLNTQGLGNIAKHTTELKAVNEALEHLRSRSEEEKAHLQDEITQLKTMAEVTKAQTAEATEALQKQIMEMKLDVERAKSHVDAITKEKDLTIERMKEDVEGKEHNIAERDVLIADLRLKIEAEKSKEPIKVAPTPADLIPDLDPWYAGSLERYIAMLRSEASEPHVEDKIKTFRAFVKTESSIRGIEFYEAPPPITTHGSTIEVPGGKASDVSKPAVTRDDLNVQAPERTQESPEEDNLGYSPGGRPVLKPRTTISSTDDPHAYYASDVLKPVITRDDKHLPALGRTDLNVQVPGAPHLPSDDEDHDYSPGGRPILKQRGTILLNHDTPVRQPVHSSTQSTAILTPTSSVDDDSNKTPVPSQSEEQPAYKAYVPPALFSTSPARTVDRRSVSDVVASAPFAPAGVTSINPRPTGHTSIGKQHDEIFFRPHGKDTSKGASRPLSSGISASEQHPSEMLADLLPTQIVPATPNLLIEEIRAKLSATKRENIDIDNLTKKWDIAATATRKQNDTARRKRQEEQEENNDDAFNNEEISYADLNTLEQEFMQKENDLKAQEDRAEYASYVKAVFDPIYNALQSNIKDLMDLYFDTQTLLQNSHSGIAALEPNALCTLAVLELALELHNTILTRHQQVVDAVAERDKRYRKTETQPLYARGDMAGVKSMQKHFDTAEKQAHIRALRDKAQRTADLVAHFEHAVIRAVGIEQNDIQHVIHTLRIPRVGPLAPHLLTRVKQTLARLESSTKALLRLFLQVELGHGDAVSEAEIAEVAFEEGDVETVREEKARREARLLDELERRVRVIEADAVVVDELLGGEGGE